MLGFAQGTYSAALIFYFLCLILAVMLSVKWRSHSAYWVLLLVPMGSFLRVLFGKLVDKPIADWRVK